MAQIPGDGNTVPFPASPGTYDPTQMGEDLGKRVDIPTLPDQPQNLPTRRGRVTEVVKEMFVWELRHYLDTMNTSNDLAPVPVVMKFASALPNPHQEFDPLETVLRIIRAYPDITERLPYVGVVASAGKNNRITMSGKYVAAVLQSPRLIAGTGPFTNTNIPPFIPPKPDLTLFDDNEVPGVPGDWPTPVGAASYGVTDNDWVEITTVVDGVVYVEVFEFIRTLLGVSPQTPRMIADVINFSARACHADVVLINTVPTLVIEPGGPIGNKGNFFEIFRSDASPNFDAYVNLPLTKLIAPSNQFPMMNRYLNSIDMTVGLIIGTDGDTLRVEVTDLIANFFTFVMNTRQFTFWGRSFYGNTQDEYLQVIIKDNEVNIIGEQEIPRPDDPARYIYVNRIDVPITLLQYIDRPVQQGATLVPFDEVKPVASAIDRLASTVVFDALRDYTLAGFALLSQRGSSRFSGTAQFDHRFAGIAQFDVPVAFAGTALLNYMAGVQFAGMARLMSQTEFGFAQLATLDVATLTIAAADVTLEGSNGVRISRFSSLEANIGVPVAQLGEFEAAARARFATLGELEAIVTMPLSGNATLAVTDGANRAGAATLLATDSVMLASDVGLNAVEGSDMASIVHFEAPGLGALASMAQLTYIGTENLAGLAEFV